MNSEIGETEVWNRILSDPNFQRHLFILNPYHNEAFQNTINMKHGDHAIKLGQTPSFKLH